MTFSIDTTSYRKDILHPQRWGYQSRGNVVPSSIIVHTTSNTRETVFETEAVFIRDSRDISAHFLIGKDGRIVQFLAPQQWQAWHAGNALPAFLNARSIGIEHHVSIGDSWTAVQHAACDQLVRQLMATYGIPPAMIETHRAVALPKGRKKDPTGWDDTAFYAWRATLAAPPEPITKRYRVKRVMISQRQEGGMPYAGELLPGDEAVVDKWYTNGYVHLQDGRGFVLLENLEAV